MTKKGGGGRASSPSQAGWRTKGGHGRGGSGGLSQDAQQALDAYELRQHFEKEESLLGRPEGGYRYVNHGILLLE